MAAPRLDQRILSRAKPKELLRLAKYIGVNVSDDCVCMDCNIKLLEVVVRKLDLEESNSSYEEIMKRFEERFK